MSGNRFTLTVLCENTAGKAGLRGEWGLSVWIETPSHKVLFDAGESTACLHNAHELGIPIAQADAVVLSHGHYDHTGGLAKVLPLLPECPVYLHEAALKPRYAKAGTIAVNPDEVRQIGMPDEVRKILEQRRNVVFVEQPTEVVPGVWVTGQIPRIEPLEGTGGLGALDREMNIPDIIPDDMAMWIDSSEGVIVVLGCAHAGVINTIRHIQSHTGPKPIIGVLGGTHLRDTSPERLDATLSCLGALPLKLLAACHCTGRKEAFALQAAFPDVFVDMSAGSVIAVPA